MRGGPTQRTDEERQPSGLDACVGEAGRTAGLRFVDSTEPVPFEEILAPLVGAARERLAHRVGQARGALLAGEAHANLERLLLRQLAVLSARALHLAFTAERMVCMTSLGRLLALADDAPQRTAYDAFTARMLAGGFDDFLAGYPVLARLIPRVSDLWVEAMAEFFERLERDAVALARTFSDRELGQVARVSPGLSDPHRSGRMVMSLEFESGVRIAYKPKDLGTERAFNQLLAWFTGHGAPLPFRVLAVIARPGYGWVEWVEHQGCRSEDEVRRYYERAGMLACLVYALAGTDCHRDNLIASGEHPMLIDSESLMHHRVQREGEPTRAREMALDQLMSGVLGTGLLPNWQVDERPAGAAATDISALHTPRAEELVEHAVRWQAINTDGMRLARTTVALPTPKSQPLLRDQPTRLDDYAAHVLSGFKRFYDFLLEQRPALLAPRSPLHDLATQPVRFLFRHTRVYGELQWELAAPPSLRSEDERRRRLETLGQALSAVADHSRWWPLIQAEQDAMDELDIPLFWARADSVDLHLAPGRELRGCLREPSALFVRDRLQALGPRDLERQLGFVAGSLHANGARHHTPDAGRASDREGASRGQVDLERVALDIAEQIRDRAIRAPSDGSATWIAPQYLPQLDRYQLQPIGHDLHSGGSGIALFLASVARVTGSLEHAQLARDAVQPLRRAIECDPEILADELGLGAGSGVGGMVYGLTRLAQLLDEPALLAEASAMAALLTEQRIARASADVFAGLAGEILGHLALHAAVRDPALLERAAACGRRLLECRRPGEGGRLAWVTFKDRLLTGFSHGTAGIAYALLRLHEVTGEDALCQAAVEAIALENALFDERVGNWPDLREDEQPAFKTAWCHGAPGIGLARLGGLSVLDTPEVRQDVEAAIDTTLRLPGGGADHLCCGNLGRAEFLLVAGERLRRPELIAAARARVQDLARRAATEGGFSLHNFLPCHVYTPGFFMGMSGIGYELLRAARPELMPSVLLWE